MHDAAFFVFDDAEAESWAEVLQKIIAFIALLSAFSAAAHEWTAAVKQTAQPWVPPIEGQLKMLYQFCSIKTGAAIQTMLEFPAGLVRSSSSSSSSSGSGESSSGGSGESASKKQRTEDITYLEAADSSRQQGLRHGPLRARAPEGPLANLSKAEQTQTQLFQWLGFRSRSAPAPRMTSLGATEGGVS
jgi:hypothetical protein